MPWSMLHIVEKGVGVILEYFMPLARMAEGYFLRSACLAPTLLSGLQRTLPNILHSLIPLFRPFDYLSP
jgi:hypothetical protein